MSWTEMRVWGKEGVWGHDEFEKVAGSWGCGPEPGGATEADGGPGSFVSERS